jgi:hypothetical protein
MRRPAAQHEETRRSRGWGLRNVTRWSYGWFIRTDVRKMRSTAALSTPFRPGVGGGLSTQLEYLKYLSAPRSPPHGELGPTVRSAWGGKAPAERTQISRRVK